MTLGVAIMLAAVGARALATSGTVQSAATNTECLGYYTVSLPGGVEYALMSNFSQGLGAWGSEVRLALGGSSEPTQLSISLATGPLELAKLIEARNKKQQEARDDLLRQAKLFSPEEAMHGKLTSRAAATPNFEQLPERQAFGAVLGSGLLTVHGLVNGHIFSTSLELKGTPAQTWDTFLSHYKPRALGEVPDGPGVCVPYGFFTREKQPATIGLNIRLKDQPDIVVYLRASDAATDAPDDPDKFFARALWTGRTFFQARGEPVPMRRFMQREKVTIDGVSGTGIFVTVKRDDDPYPTPINNAANGNLDWAYLAYVPGVGGGKPGDSFNITFKVERFGRFAQRPMTEREFRDLTLRIAASIKRRPGAWVAN